MKTGKSLTELAQALKHARDDARDFVVPTSMMRAVTNETQGIGLYFETKGGGIHVSFNSWSHSQLASYSDIPKAYYDRLIAENPNLAASNVNHGLSKKADDRRMVRSLDGQARALLSPKYRRLDSADLAEAVLPDLVSAGLEVVSSDVTERRLYLRATSPRLKADVKVGDTVQAGIMISNSDVGAGAFRVEPFLVRLICLNGMVRQHAFKKAHVGRSLAVGDDSVELLSESTLRLGEAAFWAEVRDVVRACLAPELFEREVEKLRETTTRQLKNFDLEDVVELTCQSVGLKATKQLQGSILDHLAQGGQGAGLTQWGLANAFTAAAEGAGDFDQAVELERAGSDIIDLKPSEWTVISEKKRA